MSRSFLDRQIELDVAEQLRQRLGRAPTVEELTRELEMVPEISADDEDAHGSTGLRILAFAAVVIAVGVGIAALIIFIGSPPISSPSRDEAAAESPGTFATALPRETTEPVEPASEPEPAAAPAPTPVPAPTAAPAPVAPTQAPAAAAPQATPPPRPTAPPAAAPATPAPAVVPETRATLTPADGDVVERVLPRIPAEATRTITGSVRIDVRVAVDASGAVTDAQSLTPSASRYFTPFVLQAARSWRFVPAAAGTRVIRFTLRRDGASAALAG